MDLEQVWATMRPGIVAIPGKLAASAAVLLIVALIVKILHFIIDRSLNPKFLDQNLTQNTRLKTLRSLLKSLVTYVLYIIALLYIVTLFVGPLGLTLTSIGGIALGFGAQTFIKDILSGIFILMEDKYKIGDFVLVGTRQGFVKEIGLRTTILSDFNGDLHIIPNGNIEEITNVSRGDRRFKVDISIAATDDIETAGKLLEEICEEFRKTHEEVLDGPAYVGVVNIHDIAATLRVQGRANYVHHWSYENDLRRDILQRFKEAGIQTGVRMFPEGGLGK